VSGQIGGWQATQWNFLPCGNLCDPASPPLPFQSRGGIGMPEAWQRMRALRRPGGAGVKVAVLDTGVAYRNVKRKILKSPDFQAKQIVAGYDFVDKDRFAIDEEGHGTHVAGTIAEQVNNGRGVTGIAYGAKVMPIRVLNNAGQGKAADIGAGIVWAAKRGAKIINMSFEFGPGVKSCADVRSVCRGVRIAARRGALVVAAAGNDFAIPATYPARIPGVVGVGGATEGACVGDYSNIGKGVDIFAPGGQGEGGTACRTADRPIFQLTYSTKDLKTFGYPTVYAGTSMAAAHVSAVAALVIASGELGAKPAPSRILCQLSATARRDDLGEPYDPARWGAGLIDAAAAVSGPVC
jgi:serine protease